MDTQYGTRSPEAATRRSHASTALRRRGSPRRGTPWQMTMPAAVADTSRKGAVVGGADPSGVPGGAGPPSAGAPSTTGGGPTGFLVSFTSMLGRGVQGSMSSVCAHNRRAPPARAWLRPARCSPGRPGRGAACRRRSGGRSAGRWAQGECTTRCLQRHKPQRPAARSRALLPCALSGLYVSTSNSSDT